MDVTTVVAKGWVGEEGGELLPLAIAVSGPMPGTGQLLMTLTPAGKGADEPVCVLLTADQAYELAGKLTRTRLVPESGAAAAAA